MHDSQLADLEASVMVLQVHSPGSGHSLELRNRVLLALV